MGTPNELTNQNGEVIWLSYDMAWCGQFDGYYKPQEVGSYPILENELQPIKFQGQFYDVETSLHYNRFGYFDSDAGMFISRDPIGLLGGNNVFQYAPNPVMWVDPLGLDNFPYPSREQAIANLGIKPAISSYYSHKGGYSTPAQFSDAQKQMINREWLRIYENDIQAHLAAGRMTRCPITKPTPCTNCVDGAGGWQQYGGDNPEYSYAFHCGFDGFIENRIPGENGNNAPANECFYDDAGVLVTKYYSKEKRGCRGTPDYFPFFHSGTVADKIRKDKHSSVDPGGPPGPGLNGQGIGAESFKASMNYLAVRAEKGAQWARDEIIEEAKSGVQWAQEAIRKQSEKGEQWAIEAYNELASWLQIPKDYR